MGQTLRLAADAKDYISALQKITQGTNAWATAQNTLNQKIVNFNKSIGGTATKVNKAADAYLKMDTAVKGAASSQKQFATVANQSLTQVDKKVRTVNLSLQSMVRLVAVQLAHQAIGALSRSFREGIALASDFQIKISELRTISTENQLASEAWAKGLRQVSDAWNLDLLDTVEAAYQAVSNQIAKGEDAIKFLNEAAKLATVGVATSADSVNLLSSALNAFRLDVNDTEKVAASFFKTVELGRIRISELANNFGNVGIPANTLGISLNEVNAALATITIQGVRSNQAMTFLRNVMLKLIKPTGEMKKLFRDVGVESGQAAIDLFGFGGFLSILDERTKGSTSELGKLFGRLRALQGGFSLTGDNLKTFNRNLDAISESTESYAERVGIATESVGFKLQKTLNQVRNFFIEDFGQEALRSIYGITEAMGGLDVQVLALAKTMKDILLGVTVALIPAFLKLALTNPFGVAISGAVSVAYAINFAIERFKKFDDTIVSSLDRAANSFARLNEKAVLKTVDTLSESFDKEFKEIALKAAKILTDVNDDVRKSISQASIFDKEFEDSSKGVITSIRNEIAELAKDIENPFRKAKDFESRLTSKTAGLTTGARELTFNIKFNQESIESQAKIIQNKIINLQEQASKAATDVNISVLKSSQNKINKLLAQEYKLRSNALSENQEDEEELAKLREDTADKIEDLRTNMIGVRKESSKWYKIQEDILSLQIQESNKSDEINKRIKKRSTTLEDVDKLEKRIAENAKTQQSEVLRLILNAESKRKAKIQERLALEKRAATLEKARITLRDTGLDAITSATTTEKLDELLKARQEAARTVLRLGVSDPSERKVFIAQEIEKIRVIAEARVRIEIEANNKIAQARKKAFDDQLQQTKTRLKDIQTEINKVNQLRQSTFNLRKLISEGIQPQAKLGGLIPSSQLQEFQAALEQLNKVSVNKLLSPETFKNQLGIAITDVSLRANRLFSEVTEKLKGLSTGSDRRALLSFRANLERLQTDLQNGVAAAYDVRKNLKLREAIDKTLERIGQGTSRKTAEETTGFKNAAQRESEALEKNKIALFNLSTAYNLFSKARSIFAQSTRKETETYENLIQALRDEKFQEEVKVKFKAIMELPEIPNLTALAQEVLNKLVLGIQKSIGAFAKQPGSQSFGGEQSLAEINKKRLTIEKQNTETSKSTAKTREQIEEQNIKNINRFSQTINIAAQITRFLNKERLKELSEGQKIAGFLRIAGSIASVIPGYGQAIGGALYAGAGFAEQFYKGGKVKYLATGGPSGTDTVPAMLSPGEFVVNRKSTEKFYSQLVAMNAKRYEAGGSVSNNTTVGDVHVHMPEGSTEQNIVEFGKQLKRKIDLGVIPKLG